MLQMFVYRRCSRRHRRRRRGCSLDTTAAMSDDVNNMVMALGTLSLIGSGFNYVLRTYWPAAEPGRILHYTFGTLCSDATKARGTSLSLAARTTFHSRDDDGVATTWPTRL